MWIEDKKDSQYVFDEEKWKDSKVFMYRTVTIVNESLHPGDTLKTWKLIFYCSIVNNFIKVQFSLDKEFI
jgi:hypothetical protein